MIKVPSFRFQMRFGPFTMLIVDRSSETELLRHLSKRVFRVCKFKNTSAMRVAFFKKMFKFECKFPKRQEKGRKYFFFYR